jgi:hypothetical protein
MYAYDQQQDDINGGNDDYSVTDTVPSNLLKNKQPRTKRAKCYTIKKSLNHKWTDGKYYGVVTINMYGSGDLGSTIKNAATGEYTNHRVGSEAENLYFCVANCTGLDKLHGPVHLYYDSPSQYEKHQFTILEQTTKDKWFNRFSILKDKYL